MPWKPLLQAPNRTTIALIRIKTLNKLASIVEDLALTKSKTERIQFVTRIANWNVALADKFYFVLVLGRFVNKGDNVNNIIKFASFSHDGQPFGL